MKLLYISIAAMLNFGLVTCTFQNRTTFLVKNSSSSTITNGSLSINGYGVDVGRIRPYDSAFFVISHDSAQLNNHDVTIFASFFPEGRAKPIYQLYYTDLGGTPSAKYVVTIVSRDSVNIK
jgi:hypothetical protein